MQVLKFGGTSVGSIHGVLSVKKIVEQQNEPVIVVVSALSGITDELYKIANLACEGNNDYLSLYNLMVTRHEEMIDGVITADKKAEVLTKIQSQFTDLSNIYSGEFS